MLTPEQIADGWIEHDGGHHPMNRTPRGGIPVVIRAGIVGYVSHAARTWVHTGGLTDIIAYRPEPSHD